MEFEIIEIFCVCDDVLKALRVKEDSQVKMSIAEVITTAIVAARFFGGIHERSREFLMENYYIPHMLSKSQYNRRLHGIKPYIWQAVHIVMVKVFKLRNEFNEYTVDSFPVAVCDNIRINRCKIYHDEQYRGYMPSKRRYFYGVRVHMVQTVSREPIEFIIAPGAMHDMKIFKQFDLDLPEGAIIFGDRAYNDYEYEDLLKEAASIYLVPQRKENSKRPLERPWDMLRDYKRRNIETGFSGISSLFPKVIHAVTAKGFELKIMSFIFAYSFMLL